jgi:hypothetical protein
VAQLFKTRRVNLVSTLTTQTPHQEALFREGRLELAINAYQKGQLKALRPATESYDVVRTTACRRIAGFPPKRGNPASNHLISPTAEESLAQWIYRWIDGVRQLRWLLFDKWLAFNLAAQARSARTRLPGLSIAMTLSNEVQS